MEVMNKQEKIDIINEALEILYGEVNDFSVHTDFPEERLVHVADSILKLEQVLNLLEIKKIDLTGLEDWKSLKNYTEEENDN